jgi:drug/metabolite transporter (DMT)-like permease
MSAFVVAIVLLSALIHAVWSVFIKGSQSPLAFNLIQVIPLCGIFLALLPLVELEHLSARFWTLLAITAVFHGFYLYWLSIAFELGDLSLVYPIARSTPAFLPLFAGPILGEVISPLGGLGIAAVVAGMWAVQLGGSDALRGLRPMQLLYRPELRYAYLTLATTIGYGLTDKALMTELAGMPWAGVVPRSVFCFFALQIAFSFVFVPLALTRIGAAQIRTALRTEWRRAILASLIGVAGYGFILEAMQTAKASYVVAIRQSSVIFVLVMSVLFLGERPGRLRILGAVGTVVGVAMIALAK